VTVCVDLKMASAQVVETSVTNNSPSQDPNHPDDPSEFQSNLNFNTGKSRLIKLLVILWQAQKFQSYVDGK